MISLLERQPLLKKESILRSRQQNPWGAILCYFLKIRKLIDVVLSQKILGFAEALEHSEGRKNNLKLNKNHA